MMHKNPILMVLATLFAFSSCGTVFINPDVAMGRTVDTLSQFRIEKLVVSTPIELQIVSQFHDTSVTKIPESDFFEWQDRLLHAVLKTYQDSVLLEYPSERRGDVVRIENLDNPKFSPTPFFHFLQERGLTLCTLSVVEPVVLRAVLRAGVPLLTFGQVYYKRKVPKLGASDTSSVTAVSIARRHETFDIVYGYSRLQGPASRLPGESGPKYLYAMRTGFDFFTFDGQSIKERNLPIYGRGNQSSWVLHDVIVPVKSSEAVNELADRINAELAKENHSGAFVKLSPIQF